MKDFGERANAREEEEEAFTSFQCKVQIFCKDFLKSKGKSWEWIWCWDVPPMDSEQLKGYSAKEAILHNFTNHIISFAFHKIRNFILLRSLCVPNMRDVTLIIAQYYSFQTFLKMFYNLL